MNSLPWIRARMRGSNSLSEAHRVWKWAGILEAVIFPTPSVKSKRADEFTPRPRSSFSIETEISDEGSSRRKWPTRARERMDSITIHVVGTVVHKTSENGERGGYRVGIGPRSRHRGRCSQSRMPSRFRVSGVAPIRLWVRLFIFGFYLTWKEIRPVF